MQLSTIRSALCDFFQDEENEDSFYSLIRSLLKEFCGDESTRRFVSSVNATDGDFYVRESFRKEYADGFSWAEWILTGR